METDHPGDGDHTGVEGGAGGGVHQPHDKLFKVTFSDKQDFMTKVESLQPTLRTTAMTLAEKLTQEGRQEGRQEDILDALELRFGDVPEGLREAVFAVTDEGHLRNLLRAAIQCGSLEEFSQRL